MASAPHQQPMAGVNAAAGPSVPVQAAPQPPRSLRVMGKSLQHENGDICGEYNFVKNHHGYPAYKNWSTGMVIRFHSGRWCIDRHGIRDTDVCVAYATCGKKLHCSHPAHPELVWSVYDSRSQAHVEDTEVFAIDAPQNLTFVGRGPDRENTCVNGKYTLSGIVVGRACYRHETEPLMIVYNEKEARWLIQDPKDVLTNTCCAFATPSEGSVHPGDVSSEWQFWEGAGALSSGFRADPAAGLVNAPQTVTIYGRLPQRENARLVGTYQLVGLFSRRPVYLNPVTGAIIRYAPKNNWWLIDCDGGEHKGWSLIKKLKDYLFTGDFSASDNTCSAWANARKTEHPGHIELEWSIFETMSGQFVLDTHVAATSAPPVLHVSGRDVSRENADINGEYFLEGGAYNRAFYRKPDSTTCIYYSLSGSAWVIDRHGCLDNNVFVAHARSDGLHEYPTGLQPWHVFETARGAFVPDPAVRLSVQDAPTALPVVDTMLSDVPPQMSLNIPCRGMKRGYGVESDFVDYAPLYVPENKFARTNQGGWRERISNFATSFGA